MQINYPKLCLLAREGYSMRQCAEILSVNREALRVYVSKLGDHSPFQSRWVAQNWIRHSGESIVATARRLAATHTICQAAAIIGYGDGLALRRALESRNVYVKFLVDPRNEARWHRKSA